MIYFGVDYYPEQWPEERWPVDIRLMAEAGFNVVRLAEFAWARIEPERGKFNFAWLDRAIALFHSHGIQVVLGTPTASPPPWLMQTDPALFRLRQDGVRLTYGNRREYCPNQPAYHDFTRKVVGAMAEHYASHPAVIGWQIDNEFGEGCYCPLCAQRFQDWLHCRYETLINLNRNWGTAFWSHVYNDWSEIPLPLASGGSPNPGLALDFERFVTDTYVAYQRLQVELLRRICPGQFITHNMMGFDFDRLDCFQLARDLDLISWDNYPRSQWSMESPLEPSRAALSHAAMRGLKERNFWVIEQQAGQGGWEMLSLVPRPGELRLWAYQSIAHGADGIVFFRWRTARYGAEQFWHGLLDYDARAGRRYQEIKQMGNEIQNAASYLDGSTVKSPVAMVLSYDSRFSFRIQPNNPHFRYDEHFHAVYRSFYRRHVSADVISPEADLSAYKIVILPAMHLISPGFVEKLTVYVRSGGIVLVTQRSGVKDECNAVFERRLPGPLVELCGIEVEECDSLGSTMRNHLVMSPPDFGEVRPEVGIFCEILKPVVARVLATYADDFYTGRPAVTANRVGEGQAIYVGTVGDAQLYDSLADWLIWAAGLQPILDAPADLEVTERWHGDQRILFILNHTEQTQSMELTGCFHNILGGPSPLTGTVAVEPRQVLVLQANPEQVRAWC